MGLAASLFQTHALTHAPRPAVMQLFCLVAYFMVGYVVAASNFFIFLVVYNLFQLCSETIGFMCAAVTKTSTYGILILTFVLLFLLSFSGFLVSDIPGEGKGCAPGEGTGCALWPGHRACAAASNPAIEAPSNNFHATPQSTSSGSRRFHF